MVGAGVPSEVPFQFTPKGVKNAAVIGQNALIERLGERLGIVALGGSSIQSGQAFGDMANTGEQKAKKLEEASMKRVLPIQAPMKPSVPGVYVR